MSDKTELKKCPFCGGEAKIDIRYDYCDTLEFYAACSVHKCTVVIGYFASKQEAIEDWNRRTDSWISVEDRLPEAEKGNGVLKVQPKFCTWTYDGEHCKWDTDCNNAQQFFEDSPSGNGYKYCPYCGSLIIEKVSEDDESEGK